MNYELFTPPIKLIQIMSSIICGKWKFNRLDHINVLLS